MRSYKRNIIPLYVAPLVGAWIEMPCMVIFCSFEQVAPLVGAWIEISVSFLILHIGLVAPLVGAWIEI